MTSLVAVLHGRHRARTGELAARIRPFDLKYMLDSLASYYAEIGVGRRSEASATFPGRLRATRSFLPGVQQSRLNAFKYRLTGRR